MMPRQLVVIRGMHRSGASLITKSIELLGYTLGEDVSADFANIIVEVYGDLEMLE